MRKILTISFLIMLIVWGAYYLNFGISGDVSQKTDVWGQFGDYVGGVLNPILSFISIYLLINSLSLQRQANTSLVDEIKRQEKLEDFKKFEFRFFHLVDALDKTFSRFKVCIGDMEGKDDGTLEEYKGEQLSHILKIVSLFWLMSLLIKKQSSNGLMILTQMIVYFRL